MKKIIIGLFSLIAVGKISVAQVSIDSLKSLKNQKEILRIQDRINENKIKVAKYENSLKETSRNQEISAKNAQQSANANDNAASDLRNNAENRKMANKASKMARQAKKDAARARKKNRRMENLNSNISKLNKMIVEDEQRLISKGIKQTTPM